MPVNSTTSLNASNTETALNDLFKQANVSWSVSTAPNFTFNLGNTGLEVADASLMSKYSAQMRALRNAYKSSDSLYDKAAYYVFIVPNFADPTVKGYMVRGRAVGFISANATTKELAHELAHGAFGLEHTFPQLQKSSTSNLMDYTNQTQLVKKQWEQIQSGNYELNWLDNEEDGSYQSKADMAFGVFYWINKIKVAYKNNTIISTKHLVVQPAQELCLNGRSGKCYLGGVQYDSISVYFDYRIFGDGAVVKNNKVVIGTNQKKDIFGSTITYSCIIIDNGKIIIEVPENRLSNMLYYIKNTQTFKNLILFVNGYRPIINVDGDPMQSLLEYQDSQGEVAFGDIRNYWKGIDAQFINRIGTRNAVYVDGHHSVATSNHRNVASYIYGNYESEEYRKACVISSPLCPPNYSVYLHTIPNVAGFQTRRTNGVTPAQELLYKIGTGELIFDKTKDTLDIVAHSMGYAYALGMIDELEKANIRFGRFYIIASENPGSGGTNWTKFTEVWQYGSDLGEPNQDPYWLQDGVAPQTACRELTKVYQTTKTGRVFIPKSVTTKSFLGSHSIVNYGWIFDNLSNQDKGYVKPR